MENITHVLSIHKETGAISVKLNYSVEFVQEECSSEISKAFVPGFGFYFKCKSQVEGHQKASAMLNSFFDFWFTKRTWSEFLVELETIGFITKNKHVTMLSLRKDTGISKKLKANHEAHFGDRGSIEHASISRIKELA